MRCRTIKKVLTFAPRKSRMARMNQLTNDPMAWPQVSEAARPATSLPQGRLVHHLRPLLSA